MSSDAESPTGRRRYRVGGSGEIILQVQVWTPSGGRAPPLPNSERWRDARIEDLTEHAAAALLIHRERGQ